MTDNLLSHSVFDYLLNTDMTCEDEAKLPPLGNLSKTLGVSRGKLREDLLVAQAYGIVEMRPGDGTYALPFDFYTAIRPAVLYGIACDKRNFDRFYKLRVQLEMSYWDEAVSTLDADAYTSLFQIVERAETKLHSTPIEIPHREHREFHMAIFARLDNPFVLGLLQAYWDTYEAVELHRYFELSYYEEMWRRHRDIVQCMQQGQLQQSQEALVQHFAMLTDRLQQTENS